MCCFVNTFHKNYKTQSSVSIPNNNILNKNWRLADPDKMKSICRSNLASPEHMCLSYPDNIILMSRVLILIT